MDIDGEIYRYIVSSPDAEKKAYLQIFVNEQGEIIDLVYYTSLVSFIPETIEDQDAFTGTNGEGLGNKSFSLWKEQLQNSGIPASTLDAIFENGAEELVYMRDVGHEEFMKPYQGVEVRIDDAKGVNGMEQDVYFMPYTRNVGTEREFLFISTSIVKSINGANNRSMNVEFMIGIPMELGRVVVQ